MKALTGQELWETLRNFIEDMSQKQRDCLFNELENVTEFNKFIEKNKGYGIECLSEDKYMLIPDPNNGISVAHKITKRRYGLACNPLHRPEYWPNCEIYSEAYMNYFNCHERIYDRQGLFEEAARQHKEGRKVVLCPGCFNGHEQVEIVNEDEGFEKRFQF